MRKAIDITPSWEGLMPALIAILENGKEEAKGPIRDELMRLAKTIDQRNGDGRTR